MGIELDGGCYCGALRYRITAEPLRKGQCHCRPCQHVSGGGPNYFMVIPAEGFAYTRGEPKAFRRPDLESPRTREFCGTCGTQILTRRPDMAHAIVKAGTLDDPNAYVGPDFAIFCEEKAVFHLIPDGIPAFDKMPEKRR